MVADPTFPSPPPLISRDIVDAAWTDYNGHMNVAYYVLLFDRATDAVLDHVDLGERYRAETECSIFVAEAHVTYERELAAGDRVEVRSWITAVDQRKRFVIYHEMYPHAGDALAASNEVLCVHVDLRTRRSAVLAEPARARLAAECVAGSATISHPRLGKSIQLAQAPPR